MLLTTFSTFPLNRKPRHGSAPCWACPPAHLLPHNFVTTFFHLFSDKELKELAANLSTCHRDVNAGPSKSSRARTMSVVRSFLNSVVICCSICHTKASATILEDDCYSQQSCSFLNLHQGNVFLLCLDADTVWESQGFKCILTIHCLQSIYFYDGWCWVRSWDTSEALGISTGCVP